jgi:hypothetical protein
MPTEQQTPEPTLFPGNHVFLQKSEYLKANSKFPQKFVFFSRFHFFFAKAVLDILFNTGHLRINGNFFQPPPPKKQSLIFGEGMFFWIIVLTNESSEKTFWAEEFSHFLDQEFWKKIFLFSFFSIFFS